MEGEETVNNSVIKHVVCIIVMMFQNFRKKKKKKKETEKYQEAKQKHGWSGLDKAALGHLLTYMKFGSICVKLVSLVFRKLITLIVVCL